MNFLANLLKHKVLLAILAVLAAILAFLVTTYRSEKAEQARQEAEFKAFGGGQYPSLKDALEKEKAEEAKGQASSASAKK